LGISLRTKKLARWHRLATADADYVGHDALDLLDTTPVKPFDKCLRQLY